MKGLVLDIFTIGLVVGILLFVAIIMYVVLDGLNTSFSSAGYDATVAQQARDSMLLFNYGSIILMFGGVGVALLLAFMVRSHPAFLMLSIINLIVLIPISAILSNVFMEMYSSPAIAPISEQFDIGLQIVSNFPVILTIGGFMVIIVLYSKLKGNTEVSA